MESVDVAIIGGGAAGLAAAIFAAQAMPAGGRIVVLDGAKVLGAKILVSGGGRCNVTHHAVTPRDFNGSQNVVRNVLAAFDVAATVRWFASLGVELKQEPTGKLFPVANTARAVLGALLRRCEELNIELRTDSRVTQIVSSAQTTSGPLAAVPRGEGRGEGPDDEKRESRIVGSAPRTVAREVTHAISQPPATARDADPTGERVGSEGETFEPPPVGSALADAAAPDPPTASAKADPTNPSSFRTPAQPSPLITAERETGPMPDFTIHHTHGTLHADRIILCAGGRSLPRSGSDGSGWELVQKLGHTVTPTFAALVPLVLGPEMFHAELSGIAQDVELSTFVNGKRIDHRTGSLLWTHFGISGPVVMDASRHWTSAHETGGDPRMVCNLLPGEEFSSVEKWLIRAAAERPRGAVVGSLAQRLPERVAACLLKHAGVDPSLPIGHLPRDARRAVVHALTALPLPVTQHRGWNYAEVTAGGVPLSEVDPRTMQSRKAPGLYLAGEILDCDGRIGGFNFQWAWSTAYLAGHAAAKRI